MPTARVLMPRHLALPALVLMLGSIVGCNEATQQASQPEASATPQLTRQVVMPANAPVGAGNTGLVAAGSPKSSAVAPQQPIPQSMPEIPPGARWTAFCYMIKDDPKSPVRGAHIQDSIRTRDALKAKTGRQDWYVIHGVDASNLYFGFYKSVDPNDKQNTAEVERARNDLEMVRRLKSSNPMEPYPFERGLFVALDSPDPTAPPEWNLFNVDREKNPIDPKRAFWSLQIMAFKGHQLRKEAAVQAVADLRSKGVEAYYYHGDVVSSVTVGKWTYDAVKPQNRTDELPDHAHGNAGTTIVASNVPPPQDRTAGTIDGKPTVSVAPKLEVQSSEMLKAMQQFPSHAVNYEIGIKRGQDGKDYEDPSFLVEIPRAKGNGRFENIPQQAPVAADRNADGWGRPRGPSMVNPNTPRRN